MENTKRFFALALLLGGVIIPATASAASSGNDAMAAPAATASQQQKTVKGVVIDEQGVPVIGASILENGLTANGVISDIDGNFSINVAPGSNLVISCIGYNTVTIPVGVESQITVVLSEDTRLLDEVIVIGYGTQKKSDVSGSVATVSGEKLNNIPTANAEAALQV